MDTSLNVLWAGVDWADESHQVCVVDTAGKVVASFAIAHQAEALQGLGSRLRALGPVAGVAIETPRHLIVHQLLAEGFLVYPINPSMSHKWCEGLSVAGATDDPAQAFALADGLCRRHEHLRPLLPDDPKTRELALLCRSEVSLIAHQTALVNQLQAALKEFHPVAAAWFEDWARPSAWDFVVAFPTPAAVAGASKKKLYGFLARHRIPPSRRWQEQIEHHKDASRWPSDPAAEAALPQLVASLVAVLRTLREQLAKLRRRIEALFAEHPGSLRVRNTSAE